MVKEKTQTRAHPRLLFSAEEVAALRDPPAGSVRRRMLDRLRQVCQKLTTPTDPDYLDYLERRRDVWRTRHGIFVVVPSINLLSIGYAFTGEQSFGDAARDAMMQIIDNGLADTPAVAYGQPTRGWRQGPGHDKANFAQCLAWVYDFCHDRLSEAQRARMCEYAKECLTLADQWREFDAAQVTNNRGSRGLMAPALLCLAFAGDTPIDDAHERILRGAVALEKFLFLAFDPDGAPYEGPGYAEGAIYHITAAAALARAGHPNLLTNNRLGRLAQYLLYELVPGSGSVNNLNDTAWPCGSVAATLPAMSRAGGEILPWLARQLELSPVRSREWLDNDAPLDFWLSRILLYMLWWRDDLPVRTPQELGYPLSHCFRTRGVASMRTGWGDDDWLVSHFCGRQEYACHRQGDFNHIALYALGESFLVDAGYGSSDGDPKQPKDPWFRHNTAHNCVVMDGMLQRVQLPMWGWSEGRILDFAHNAEFDTSLGDASASMGEDHRVRQALRRVALVRGGPARFVAVLDVNEKDGNPFLAEALWHTHPENAMEPEQGGFIIRGRKHDCVVRTLCPPDATLSISRDHGRPQARISHRGPIAEMVTIFCPLRRGDARPAFTCAREGPGVFRITCEMNGKRSRLLLPAITVGPLRQPQAPQFHLV